MVCFLIVPIREDEHTEQSKINKNNQNKQNGKKYTQHLHGHKVVLSKFVNTCSL